MVEYLVSYFEGEYASMTEWPIRTPGLIRRILYAFLLTSKGDCYVSFGLHHLKPVQTADENDEIQICTQRSIKIYTAAGFDTPILFMLCEMEIDYPGEAPRTPP